MFIKGGSLVPAGYKPETVLVKYRAEGVVPAGAEYLLIQTERGPAILERGQDGSGTLFETHWKDSAGDHYAGWVATSHAYEYVISGNNRGPGKKYVYPKGYYSIQSIEGVSRPVPVVKIDAVATLIPKK
jgi:hypothetical protein